jgi:hypothetical protein
VRLRKKFRVKRVMIKIASQKKNSLLFKMMKIYFYGGFLIPHSIYSAGVGYFA